MRAIRDLSPSLTELTAENIDAKAMVLSCRLPVEGETPLSAYDKIRGKGPSFLLETAESHEKGSQHSYLGSQPRALLRIRDGQRYLESGQVVPCRDILQPVQELLGPYSGTASSNRRFGGGAVGYFSYEAAQYFERIPLARNDPLDCPDVLLCDFETVADFDHERGSLELLTHIWLDKPLRQAYAEAAERLECLASTLDTSPVSSPGAWTAECPQSNLSDDAYCEMVREGKELIAAGDILQVVLSRRLSSQVSGDPLEFYRRLCASNPSPYMYFLDFGDHQLVGSSPELLLRVEGGNVLTRPIAGTRKRGVDSAEDERLANELLADQKEQAEHLMLVDLARNDVGRVSSPGSVQVSNFMNIERFSHVMHLTTDVGGTLSQQSSALDAFRAAFPAGTVSGAPKIRAMEIIADLEPDRRGPYAGAVGFLGGQKQLEMAITIRTGLIKDGVLHVQAGAGIVADSVPERELQETTNKAKGLLEAADSQP